MTGPVSNTADSIDYFQKYMPGDVCFGYGHENPYGLTIKSFWKNDDCVCIWKPEEKHQGWPGLTCGGIISTLMAKSSAHVRS
jgi:hypothetical protein